MSAPPIAVIDIGTNSTRLLVAEVRDGRVEELERRTTVTRLGEGVDESGRLAADAVERVAAAVGEYREIIDRLGAERVVAVATSAVRDAANASELVDVLRERHGVEVRTISGDEEARLTFLGATAGADAGQHAHPGDRHRRRQHRIRGGPARRQAHVPRVHAHGLGPPHRATPPLRPAGTG